MSGLKQNTGFYWEEIVILLHCNEGTLYGLDCPATVLYNSPTNRPNMIGTSLTDWLTDGCLCYSKDCAVPAVSCWLSVAARWWERQDVVQSLPPTLRAMGSKTSKSSTPGNSLMLPQFRITIMQEEIIFEKHETVIIIPNKISQISPNIKIFTSINIDLLWVKDKATNLLFDWVLTAKPWFYFDLNPLSWWAW